MATETLPKRAYTVSYVRGTGNTWSASIKERPGPWDIDFEGVASYSTAMWEGEEEGDERFALITVFPTMNSEVSVPTLSQLRDEALRLANEAFIERHPGAVIELEEDDPISR